MGHDKGNVPLTLVLLVALLCTLSTAAGQPPSRVRCGFAAVITPEYLNKIEAGIQAQLRPELPLFVEDASGRFRVHYTTTGADAVPAADTDGNGIPDYVDECLAALALAWAVEVDTLGYLAPPSDLGEGGSNAIDVYLRDLSKAGPSGSSYYGVTRLDRSIGSGPARFTTWIEIDNNFSAEDVDAAGNQSFGTFGIDGARVTCAHEFHHTIQNGSYGLASTQLMFYELTSTWMELRTWPRIRDWAIYMSALLNTPEQWPMSDPASFNGYLWGWYGNVFSASHPDLLRDAWNRIRSGSQPFSSLLQACAAGGQSLADMFHANLLSMYYTGSRGGSNTLVPGASELPEVRLWDDVNVTADAVTSIGALRPFEVRALRFAIPSNSGPDPVSATVLLTWPEESLFAQGSTFAQQTYNVTVTNSLQPGDAAIAGTQWGVRVLPESIRYVIDGAQTVTPGAPYPQPLRLSANTPLSVPVGGAVVGTPVTVTISTVNMVGIASETTKVVLDGTRLVAKLSLNADIPPGTYVATTECLGVTNMFKIAVVR